MPVHITPLMERASTQGHGEEYLSAGAPAPTPATGNDTTRKFAFGLDQTFKYPFLDTDIAGVPSRPTYISKVKDLSALMLQL